MLSFVRDPIDRALSHYRHLQRLAGDLPGYEAFRDLDFDAFLRSESGRAEITNVQTNLYSEMGTVLSPMLVDRYPGRREALSDHLSDPARLEEAVAFVGSLDHVGTTENWRDVMSGVSAAMRWPAPDSELHLFNRADHDPAELSAAQKAELTRLNTLDLELYETVRDLEREALEEAHEYAAEAEEAYRKAVFRRRRSFYWQFDAPFFATGIYQREAVDVQDAFGRQDNGYESGGRRIFSYWGGEEIAFDVWLEPGSDYRLRCQIDFLPEFNPEATKLSVNAAEIPATEWRSVAGNEMTIVAEVPAALLDSDGFARIRLTSPGQAQIVPGDSRALALHLQWIEVMPADGLPGLN